MQFRYYCALWSAKLIGWGMRLLHRSASYLPGRVALRICPDLMRRVQKAPLVVAVSGTDGKTTTSNLTADMMQLCGFAPVGGNRYGSNTEGGVATALVNSVNWLGRCRVRTVVLEVDEHYTPIILPQVRADYLLVTGLFRDSLQRNAHPEYVFGKMDRVDCPDMKLILNADELRSSGLLKNNPRLYFGAGPLPGDTDRPENLIDDMPYCPRCGKRLGYDYVHYAHVGRAHCPSCGFTSPAPDFCVTAIDTAANTLRLAHGGGETVYPLVNEALYNIYNEAAVIALFTDLGVAEDTIRAGLAQIKPPESRFSAWTAGGVQVVKVLAKSNNSLPVSLLFDHVRKSPGRKAVILAVDDLQEAHSSERIAWIYDADYEFLVRDDIVQIMVVGARRYDHVVRLLLAGCPEEKIVYGEDELATLDELAVEGVDSIFLLQDNTSYDLGTQAEKKIRQILEARKS